ncbi:MAG: hypothetical protein Q8916_03220 [Bacteroidota bacterium]|nr:hypothetical protein [Bacteroidota bacterium]MDP4229399.1 hypothetical protein [Bacteroidota bacterium]MDP4237352.1 hypothetical protein [Bacteroidota bacterium]
MYKAVFISWHYLLASMVLVTVSTGCQSNSASNPASNVIMPLASGNEWIYVAEGFDSKGNLIHNGQDTTKIVSVSAVNGETMYFDADSPLFRHAYFYRRDGLWSYSYEFEKLDTSGSATLLLPFPMSLDSVIIFGTAFRLVNLDTGGSIRMDTVITTITVKNNNLPISVPAGSFVCILYRQDDTDTFTHEVLKRRDSYYALNVGLVYEEDFSSFLAPLYLQTSLSLRSYTLH